MIKILQPQVFIRSIYQLDLNRLKKKGLAGLILDLDNTLVGWNNPEVPEKLLQWFISVRQHQFQMCIVSNNLPSRVEQFAKQVGVMSIAKAAKPRKRSFRRAMGLMGTHRRNTAVIGDQVFTDILGGNRLRLFTILVHPLEKKEFWTTRLVRQVEQALVPRPFVKNFGTDDTF